MDAVLAVAAGESRVDSIVIDALMAARSAERNALSILTARERQVLGEIAAGRSNRAIAEELVLSSRAIEKHINAIFGKLGLSEDATIDRRVTAVLMFLAR
jgi:DNA-binding NarL/FixJ family response regulator